MPKTVYSAISSAELRVAKALGNFKSDVPGSWKLPWLVDRLKSSTFSAINSHRVLLAAGSVLMRTNQSSDVYF